MPRTWFAIVRWWTLAILLVWTPGAYARQPEVAEVEFVTDREAAAPGGQGVIAVVLTLNPGWHVNPNVPVVPKAWDFVPIPTVVVAAKPQGLQFGQTQYPASHLIPWDFLGDGKPLKYGVYDDRAVFFVPVVISPDASGEASVELTLSFQACEKVCLPEQTVTKVVKFQVKKDAPAAAKNPLFEGFDPTGFSTVGVVAKPPAEASKGPQPLVFRFFGLSFSIEPQGLGGLALVTVIAFAGGLLMNLTPCVLPVLPLKVMSLTQGGKDRRVVLALGIVMALGVVAFWAGMGVIVAVSTSFKSVSQIMGYWPVTMGIGLFIAVMGAGMLGAFAVGLPDWVYNINAGHDSVRGSFMFGVLTALLAAPCVAPLWGTAAGWAAFQPPWVTLIVFASGGVGMALPYLVLAIKPQWLSRVPRTGPASDLLKQVLGLLMFAVAAFFVGSAALTLTREMPYLGPQLHWWGVAVFALVAGVWLLLRAPSVTKSAGGWATVFLVLILIPGGATWWAWQSTKVAKEDWEASRIWNDYDPVAYEAAVKAGGVVVLDFTADWCFICKSLEHTVLSTSEARAALSQPGVKAFRADLSSKSAPGWKALHDLNEVGIPLLVVRGPGLDQPIKNNAYTSAWVVETLTKAKGP